MSDLALRLIEENKRTKAPVLDLGGCGLSEIPDQVSELTWLESLSFASAWHAWDGHGWRPHRTENNGKPNRIFRRLDSLAALKSLRSLVLAGIGSPDLEPLATLTALETLDLSSSDVTDLNPLSALKALKALDVSNTPVASIAAVAGASQLSTLRVFRTELKELDSVRGHKRLTALDISHTPVVDLTPLSTLEELKDLFASSTKILNLDPLRNVRSLRSLQLWGTPITDLEALTGLVELQTLWIQNTRVKDLSPLAHLPSLQALHASGTRIEDLTALSNVRSLTSLFLSDTRVANLTPLEHLVGLRTLDVAGTDVTDLAPIQRLIRAEVPVRWSSNSWEGAGIYVENCPLINPPTEIAYRGNDAVLSFFRDQAAGEVERLYEAKLMILGEGGAGKTSLVRRLYQPGEALPAEEETTKGISVLRTEFDLPTGHGFRLNVWDFGGQEIYHATHQFFLTRHSIYVLLDDTRKDHKAVSDEGFKYWLELIDVLGGHSPVFIFQNEKGGRTKSIDVAGIKGRFENVQGVYSGDLLRADASDALKRAIEFIAPRLEHIGERLPAGWLRVRQQIETIAATTPYITRDAYFQIYAQHLSADRENSLRLSSYLHDIGVVLHFQDDPVLKHTVILQNDWVTQAVFRILDDELVKARGGRFADIDCNRLWSEPQYADMHQELLTLMQRFELCYLLPNSAPQRLLAPQLLSPCKPDDLAGWARPDDLVVRYRYQFLPKGIVSRLTVRMHRFVRDADLAWTTGALFEHDGTAVKVELLARGNEIELRAQGPERKALLSVIAADLEALNQSFHGLRDKVDKCIPCNCGQCRLSSQPEFLLYSRLVQRKKDGRFKLECARSYEFVDVLELLEGIPLSERPTMTQPREPEPTSKLQVLRVFLASSEELREDRDDFELYVRQRNDQHHKDGRYFSIVRWENFLDAMSTTSLQDEYNAAVRDCDIFVGLFATKVGRYTRQEFETAYGHFKTTGLPRIFTFFKDSAVRINAVRTSDVKSLDAFKKRLKQLGHFQTVYKDIEHLKLQFRDQLDKLFS
jgi:internalin A